MTTSNQAKLASTTAASVDASGTTWRLRSLVAMGHDTERIAAALDVPQDLVEKILRGDVDMVGSEFRDLAIELWDAWWDKRPPLQTHSERRRAAFARHRAEQNDWCPPLGLDEDELDEPGYRPYARYREVTGTGTAGEFRPLGPRGGLVAPERMPPIGISEASHADAAIMAAISDRQRSAEGQPTADSPPPSPGCPITPAQQPERRPDLMAVLALDPDRALVRSRSASHRVAVRGEVLAFGRHASRPSTVATRDGAADPRD